jgi:hypothetical protein
MPNANDVTPAEGGNGTEGTGNAAPVAEAKSVSDLPKWAQDELSRARGEAASYRTQLRDAESARDSFKTQYEEETAKVQGISTERDDAKLFGLKLDAALDVGVPGDSLKVFADRLRGSTLDELKADAKTLKENGFGVPASGRPTDRSAGLGNDRTPTPENAFGDFIGDKLGWGK